MERSPLPIELCEAVMNALPDWYEFARPRWLEDLRSFRGTIGGQRALCACALTCRAWRLRAQYLLSTFPHILNDARLAHFTTAVQESPIAELTLGDYYYRPPLLDASKASELFMRSCVRLQHFRCTRVSFDNGPPLRLLRMRLPFFASITTLRLWMCTFQSFRAMMDVVWACPNLALLDICLPEFKVKPSSAAGIRQMFAAVEHLRACQKLKSLYLDINTLPITWGPTSAGLSGVGRVFGCAMMELCCERVEPYLHKRLRTLLRDSFPALHSITVTFIVNISSPRDDDLEQPLLHIIAIGRPIPGRLKNIVLKGMHDQENNRCCKLLVGTSEEVAGSEKRMPELLAGLEELTIRFDERKYPERCAEYIWSVLPGMRDALRFEYRPNCYGDWLPYTIPATTY